MKINCSHLSPSKWKFIISHFPSRAIFRIAVDLNAKSCQWKLNQVPRSEIRTTCNLREILNLCQMKNANEFFLFFVFSQFSRELQLHMKFSDSKCFLWTLAKRQQVKGKSQHNARTTAAKNLAQSKANNQPANRDGDGERKK